MISIMCNAESAFCLTLVLFALWKDNQFLPDQKDLEKLVPFLVVLVINVLLSIFMSTSVLPVYALASLADKSSFPAAVEFLDQSMR